MSCHQPTGHQTHPEAMDRMGGGQSGGKVTKVPIDENKIGRGGMEGVEKGGGHGK